MDIIQNNETLRFKLNKSNIKRLNDTFAGKNVVRFFIAESTKEEITCEYSFLTEDDKRLKNIFDFNPRKYINDSSFTAVMVIPTGIGAEISGDSGDGRVAVRLIGNSVDRLITHPNVVNAADINEMTPNTYYIEGSILNRFMMGTIGLSKANHNRILIIFDEYFEGKPIEDYVKACSVNAASSLRMTIGNDIDVIGVKNPPEYKCIYNDRGMTVGRITNIERLLAIVDKYKNEYDCFALHTVTETELETSYKYFVKDEIEVNPWSGLEAMITHTISNLCNVRAAHAPMLADGTFEFHYPIVDTIKSAETLSKTELFCLLNGLTHSPKLVEKEYMNRDGVITNENISCLIVPDRCIGLPVLAALEQDIPVIAVEDKQNLMNNSLESLSWKPGKFFKAKNYLEVVGIINCLKNGICPKNFERPIKKTKILG